MNQEDEYEVGIEWLRNVSVQAGIDVGDVVISHSGKLGSHDYTEWITTQPINLRRTRDEADQEMADDEQVSYMRWIHCPLDDDDLTTRLMLEERARSIRKRGEACKLVTHREGFLHSYPYQKRLMRTWHNPPPIFRLYESQERGGQEDFMNFISLHDRGFSNYELRIRTKKKGGQQWLTILREAIRVRCDIIKGLEWIADPASTDKVAEYLLSYLSVSLTALQVEYAH